MIITLARQCGSGGTQVGRALSEKYRLPLFDMRALSEAGKATGLFERTPEFFAERPMNSLLSAISLAADKSGVRRGAEKILAELLPPDDFILIGRCGNVVYGDRPNCVRVLLCGEFVARVKVLRERYSLSQSTAEERVRENDENRLAYHKYYTGEVWGKADQYDLTINSCRLGFIRTEELIEHYVDQVLGR